MASSSKDSFSSKGKGSHKVLLEETVVATPMPQASSTVENKFRMNRRFGKEEMPSGVPTEDSLFLQELSLERKRTALIELERKLERCTSHWNEEQSLTSTQNSNMFGDSTFGINHPSSLKMGTLMEESGFTNLHNVSDLEYEEKKRLKNLSYLPSSQSGLSFTVQNSKIDPPDFMPTDDSLFCNLQPHGDNRDKNCTSKEPRQVTGEKGQELPSLTHETTDLNKYTPTIEELSSALKDCLEDTDPRKIMEHLLKAGKNKSSVATEALRPHKPCFISSDPSSGKSSCLAAQSTDDMPVTLEEFLIWGSVEIGQGIQKSLHFFHNDENSDKYKFSIQGSNAFKIVDCSSRLRGLTSSAVASVDHKSSYELNILFCPNMLGQASGFLVIQSELKKKSKMICLNAFGGKSRLIIHGIAHNCLSNIQCLTLNNSLKTIFNLENIGSAPLFYYFDDGLIEERFEIKPKMGVLNAGECVDVHLSVKLAHWSCIESISSSQKSYLDLGTLKIYFGDNYTRLRLKQLISSYGGEPEISAFIERHPFLTCNRFPFSDIVMNLDDPSKCFEELFYDGTEKMEVIIKARRTDLLLGLANLNQDHLKLLARSKKLTLQY